MGIDLNGVEELRLRGLVPFLRSVGFGNFFFPHTLLPVIVPPHQELEGDLPNWFSSWFCDAEYVTAFCFECHVSDVQSFCSTMLGLNLQRDA